MIPTPDFNHYPNRPGLVSASADGDSVVVEWADGHRSRFHAIWLLDNCACEACIDPHSRERVNGFLDLPESPQPESVTVGTEGELQIDWQHGHHSRFHPGWLRAFDYAGGAQLPASGWCAEPWDNDLQSWLPVFDADAVLNDPPTQLDWLQTLRRLGITILRPAPLDREGLEAICAKLGLLRDMNWGRIFEIRAEDDGEYISNKHGEIIPHMDAPTREHVPGIQIFQGVENTVRGGESYWVDGLHIANLMRERHPEDFALLSSVPWSRRNRSAGTDHEWSAPLFNLDADGSLREIRDTHWLRDPLLADYELVPAMYRAYRIYSTLTADPANQVQSKLDRGDIAFVDNRRVLHARRSFDPGTGLRHIRTCYAEREEVDSTIRMLLRERARECMR